MIRRVLLKYFKIILLIFISFSASFIMGNSIHEFGHAVFDYLYGIPISNIHVVIHPFFSPHMVIDGGTPNIMIGWPDAAGPLANTIVGLILFSILWKFRKPWL